MKVSVDPGTGGRAVDIEERNASLAAIVESADDDTIAGGL
jgi:hypothetical protein